MLTRRTLLAASAGFGAAALGGRALLRAAEAAERQPLRIPELIDARRQGQSIALTAQRGRTAFLPGRPTPTLGYNGTYPTSSPRTRGVFRSMSRWDRIST